MLCRNRWAGLEQEGFGIVFLEAAASGVAQIAGRSGGSHEAVLDGETGLVVGDPRSVKDAAQAIAELLADNDRRHKMEIESRTRSVESCTYDLMAAKLGAALGELEKAQ